MAYTDVLIIGSGLAALQLATQLDDRLDITILTKSKLKTSNSALAQGGISAAIDQEDHPTVHAIDTIQAGCYLNNQDVVTEMTQQAPEIIEQLTNQGCPFDQSNHHFILGKEGAHSHRRIVKSGGDQTGKAIIDTLIKQLPSNVKIIEHAFVYELLTKNPDALVQNL
ncbi:FAD-binding protein [Piscibacillus sp. B03]|uniref:FAD-binding protein n=1 Tax=Piscibacillus sp. B03 TaxID=3457430 RepID=UPI003FCEACCC